MKQWPKFLIRKWTRCNNFSNLFWRETLRVSDSSPVHHKEFFTVNTAMLYNHTGLLTALRAKQILLLASCQQTCMIKPLLWVQWKTPDDGQENCPKHIEFHFKNKFEKSVHLVGFIIGTHQLLAYAIDVNILGGGTHTLTLILRRSRAGMVWFYTSTNNKRAARPKLYTESLTRDLKRMYSRLTLARISINL
jgi:hypothetical protein